MLSDLYGILKEGGDGVDARGRVETCGDCDDAAAAGRDDDCAGNPLAEGVAPITTGLRKYMEAYKPIESDGAIEISRIGTIGYAWFIEHCDSIDAVHAQLERDYKDLGGTGANDEQVFNCSECGCVLSLYDRDGANTLCTHFIYDYPRYCPCCGREVMDE